MKKLIFILLIVNFLGSCTSEIDIAQSELKEGPTYESYDIRGLISDHKTSLVHYLNFDDVQIIDYGIKSAPITTTGSPILARDVMGNSIEFNGAGDGQQDYFSIDISDEDVYTFSYWIYNNSVSDVVTQYLFFSNRFLIHDRGSNRVQFEYAGTAGRTVYNTTTLDAYNADEWNHIAITANLINPFPGDSTGKVKIYINGEEVAVNIEAEGSGSLAPNLSGNFADSLNLTRPFVGKYDEVGILNRILSEAEIKSIYNAQK
jgi:hypothetical protein